MRQGGLRARGDSPVHHIPSALANNTTAAGHFFFFFLPFYQLFVPLAATLAPVPPPSLPALNTRETPAGTRPQREWQPPAARGPSTCKRNALPGRRPGSAAGQSSEENNIRIKISSEELPSAPETPLWLLPRGAAPGRGRPRAKPPRPTDYRPRRPWCSRQRDRTGQGDRPRVVGARQLRPCRCAWAAIGAISGCRVEGHPVGAVSNYCIKHTCVLGGVSPLRV